MKKKGWIILGGVFTIWGLIFGGLIVDSIHDNFQDLKFYLIFSALTFCYIGLIFMIAHNLMKELSFSEKKSKYIPNKKCILKIILSVVVGVIMGGFLTDYYLNQQEENKQKKEYIEQKRLLNKTPEQLAQEDREKERMKALEKEQIRQENIQLREALNIKKNIKYHYPSPSIFLLEEAFINKETNNLTNRVVCLRYRYGRENATEFNQIFVNGKINTALNWNKECNEEIASNVAHIIDLYDFDYKR